eukprot:5272380-Prymnesium_polylepis.1
MRPLHLLESQPRQSEMLTGCADWCRNRGASSSGSPDRSPLETCLRAHCSTCSFCRPPPPPPPPFPPAPPPPTPREPPTPLPAVAPPSPAPRALPTPRPALTSFPPESSSAPPRPPIAPSPPMPCYAAGRTNVFSHGGADCGVLRQKEHCDAHYYERPGAAQGAAASTCAWNARARRCELGHRACLASDTRDEAMCFAKRLAFVHIPKAAGSGVAGVLNECAADRFYWEAADRPPQWHVSAKEYIAEWAERTGTCTAARLDPRGSRCAAFWRRDVFSLAVVREPYARMVSTFHGLLDHDCTERKHRPTAPNRQCELRRFPFVETDWRASPPALHARFRRWISDLDAAYPLGSSKGHLFSASVAPAGLSDASQAALELLRCTADDTCLTPCTSRPCLHTALPEPHFDPLARFAQLAWLEDGDGALAVSVVVRLEDGLDDEWSRIARECLPSCPSSEALPRPNAAGSIGASAPRQPVAEYYDVATRDILQRRYARDFRAFLYNDTLLW